MKRMSDLYRAVGGGNLSDETAGEGRRQGIIASNGLLKWRAGRKGTEDPLLMLSARCLVVDDLLTLFCSASMPPRIRRASMHVLRTRRDLQIMTRDARSRVVSRK